MHCVKASEVHKSSMRNSIKSREKQNRATKNHLSEKPARRICCEKKKKESIPIKCSIRVSQRRWKFSLEAGNAKKHGKDKTVVIKVKLF